MIADSNPCENDASCVEMINGYECACQEDFSGDNCEIDEFFGEE